MVDVVANFKIRFFFEYQNIYLLPGPRDKNKKNHLIMGTAQSTPTRKITIPNEESQFIKISESVAERLRKCTETSPQDMMKNQPKDECEPAENHFKNVKNSEPNPECKVFDNCFSPPLQFKLGIVLILHLFI